VSDHACLWCFLKFAAPLGETAGKWNLTVTLPGQKPPHFENRPGRHPEWNMLDRIGFISQGDTDAEIWIDDLTQTQ
tara:strand:+ start:3316 stop:3543 length:228 start_codon:yes stop_codon:yes gene_type:complete